MEEYDAGCGPASSPRSTAPPPVPKVPSSKPRAQAERLRPAGIALRGRVPDLELRKRPLARGDWRRPWGPEVPSVTQIYREILSLVDKGQRGALATVIGSRGSTPGKESAKMLIREDGSTFGTIGGGCTEAEVWALAREVINTDRPLRRSFTLTPRAAEEEGLACGGVVEIFVEPVGCPSVIIFGAGHIARMLSPLLLGCGFQVTVVDDREQFASAASFPPPARVLVSEFEASFGQLVFSPSTSVVIVTRGHRHDQLVLSRAVRTDASYVGLIGSRSKILRIFHALRSEGVSQEALARVRAPIGLDIGARSPEEIAISIAAQVIAHRRRAYVKGTDPARRSESSPAMLETPDGQAAHLGEP